MSALSRVARQEYYVELGNSLPPPLVDQPEHRQRRLTAAVEAFEALCPGDTYEARLAVQIVLSGAHAAESLREAGVYREDFAKRSRCRAQAASMMREERAASGGVCPAATQTGRVPTARLARADRHGRGLRAAGRRGRAADPPRPRRHATWSAAPAMR